MEQAMTTQEPELLLAPGEEHKEPVEYRFYGDTVSIFYDDEEHLYFRRDSEDQPIQVWNVTSITHIIDRSAALMNWTVAVMAEYLCKNYDCTRTYSQLEFACMVQEAKVQHRKVKEQAADIGSIVHDWLESLIKMEMRGHLGVYPALPMNEQAANGCIAALDWMAEHKVIWLAAERKIYHAVEDYAGTMDGLAYVDGKLSVVDWKSGNRLYRLDHGMQTAAYKAAQEHELGLEIEDRWVIRIDKHTGEFEDLHLPAETFADDYKAFRDALSLTRSVERVKQNERNEKAIAKAEKKAAKDAEKEAEKLAKAADKAVKKAEKELTKAAQPKRTKPKGSELILF